MNIPIQQLGFDFDGVIADTAEAFVKLACERHNYCSFSIEDIVNFELDMCLDIPSPIIEEIFTDILTDSIRTQLQPMAGAIETLESFTEKSFVTIITARSLDQPVYDWLELFLSKNALKKMRIVATGDHDDKVRHIHQHNLKYFIDDRAETCMKLAKEDITPVVFTQPWNEKRHNLHKVNSWKEIHTLVQD